MAPLLIILAIFYQFCETGRSSDFLRPSIRPSSSAISASRQTGCRVQSLAQGASAAAVASCSLMAGRSRWPPPISTLMSFEVTSRCSWTSGQARPRRGAGHCRPLRNPLHSNAHPLRAWPGSHPPTLRHVPTGDRQLGKKPGLNAVSSVARLDQERVSRSGGGSGWSVELW